MGFLDALFGKKEKAAEAEYIDLGEWLREEEKLEEVEKGKSVKVAELYRYEDLAAFTKHVYDGNLLLLDISPIASDDFALKRVTRDLQQVSRDVGGDLAGVSRNLLMCTPKGVKIDRKKVRGTLEKS